MIISRQVVKITSRLSDRRRKLIRVLDKTIVLNETLAGNISAIAK